MSVMDQSKKPEPPERWRPMYSEVIKDLIVEHVRNGVPTKFASQAAGVHPTTMHRWLNRGTDALNGERDGTPIADSEMQYAKFAIAMYQARGSAVAERVAQVNQAADSGVWQASAWWLERQESNEFGRVDRTEHTGAEGGPIEIAQADIVKQAMKMVQEQTQRALNA